MPAAYLPVCTTRMHEHSFWASPETSGGKLCRTSLGDVDGPPGALVGLGDPLEGFLSTVDLEDVALFNREGDGRGGG